MTTLQDHIDMEQWDKVLELISKDKSLIEEIDPYDLAWKVFQYALVENGKEEYYYDYCSFDDLKKTVLLCKNLGLKLNTIPQATAFQDIDRIKSLLANGHNIDEQDFGGRTGLIVSALLNDFELTRFLIDNKSWISFFDQDSLEAIDFTCDKNIFQLLKSLGGQTKSERDIVMGDYYDAVEVSNDLRATQMEFMNGAENGDILKMESALNKQKGFWVLNGSWPVNGKTALHLSIEKNKIEATKFLLDKGLDRHKANFSGETPIDLARRLNLVEILKLMDADRQTEKKA